MCEYFSHFDGRKRRLILKFRAQTKCVRPNKAVTCQLQTQSSHERGEMCVCVCVEYLHNLDAERCQAQHFYHTYMYVYKRYMYIYININIPVSGLGLDCLMPAKSWRENLLSGIHPHMYSHIHSHIHLAIH